MSSSIIRPAYRAFSSTSKTTIRSNRACLRSSSILPAHLPSPSLFVKPSTSYQCSRPYSAYPPPSEASEISDAEYSKLANMTMDTMHDSLEELVEGKEGETGGWEVEYSTSSCGKSGVLTLDMGSHGTYVINKQPPNKQIWLSSPVSGPKRFSYSLEAKQWIYGRDGTALGDLLRDELSRMVDRRVALDIGDLDQ